MKNLKLSEHFDLQEFTYSDTAIKYNALNTPTNFHIKVLKHTCEYCLEKLRTLLNSKYIGTEYKNKTIVSVGIRITSGYRNNELNQILKKEGYKPSKNSQHCTGEAADIEAILNLEDATSVTLPYSELYSLIKFWVRFGVLSVDQCIKEKQGSKTWVHISHSAWGASKDRKEFKIFNGVRYVPD